MSIRVSCMACNQTGSVPDTHAGKTVKCRCGGLIAVPDWTLVEDGPHPSVTQQVIVNNTRSPFPHGLHAALTLFTCGMWLPVWLVHFLLAR